MELLVALVGITGLGVMIWAIVAGVRRRAQWGGEVRRGFWQRFGCGYAALFLAMLLDPTEPDFAAVAGLLTLTGIGLIIWSGLFASRNPGGWNKTITRGFVLRFVPGVLVFGVALAVGPPAGSSTQVTSESPPPAAEARPSTPPVSASPTSTAPRDVPADVPAEAQRAVVVSVDSGEAVRITAIEDGPLPSSSPLAARLLHVRATEECFQAESTVRLRELAPVGSVVWVRPDVESRDELGRYLLYVWAGSGAFINADLVAGGFAAAEFMPPNSLRWEEISAAGEQAGAVGAGPLAECARAAQESSSPEPSPRPNPDPEQNPRPQPSPAYTPPADDEDDGGSAYYSNCKAAKAAGAAPLRRGEPGYGSHLDRDGDGVACES